MYQYWRHQSGEVYAVRIERGTVTGICGPLHHSEVVPDTLPSMHYDDQPDDIDWANEHKSEFVLHDLD